MGRASLLTVLAASFVIGIMNLSIQRSTSQSTRDMVGYYSESVARVIANEGMCYVLTKLADSSSLRVKTFRSLPTNLFADMGSYSGGYTIKGDSLMISGVWKKVVKLLLYATYLEFTDTVVVYADSTFGFKPVSIRGAFTANDTINKTISDMYIDGRDHDKNGNLLPGPGVFGVSTSVPFQNVQKGYIGGTSAAGVNYAPTYPESSAVIEQNCNWLGGFPNSPDGALGYPEGTLKGIALTGVGGSQYTTDPNSLVLPLKGVTYVEVPPGDIWDIRKMGNKLGEDPEGILIVHNSTGNARVRDLQTKSKKTPFRGIVIADYAFHLHIDIFGAILLLSNQLEKNDECNGNKDHKVYYSSQAVKDATSFANSTGSGWQGRVPIIGWLDVGVKYPIDSLAKFGN